MKNNMNEWKDHFNNQESIMELLDAVGIAGYEFIRIDRSYVIDDERINVAVFVKNIETGYTEQISIDYINSQPLYQQVLDLTYSIGKDSNKRIIVFNPEISAYIILSNDELSKIVNTVNSFISIVNQYGFNFYLAEAQLIASGKYGYKLSKLPVTRQIYDRSQLPSEKKFREIEFWICYFGECDAVEFNITAATENPNVWLDYSFYRDEYHFELTYEWTDAGLFLIAKATKTPAKKKFLEYLYEDKSDMLKELVMNFRSNIWYHIGIELSGNQIDLKKETDKPYELWLQLTDLPFDEMLNSRCNYKYHVSQEMYKTAIDFDRFTDEVYNRLSAVV